MALTRVHVGFTPAQMKVLDRLTKKLMLDRNSVIRLALSKLDESESAKPYSASGRDNQ
jgi:hypothetical protein